MPEEAGQADAGNEGGGGLMTGGRGWIIVISVVILEAVFFIVLLKVQSDKKPADTEITEALARMTSDDFIKKEVTMNKLTYSIPMPSGQPMTLAMDLVLVMEPLPREIREKVLITEMDWALFESTVKKMVPWIQDMLNRTVNKMSSSELSTDRGQQMIRDIVKDKVNDKLRNLKLDLSSDKVGKERITEVLITNYYFN